MTAEWCCPNPWDCHNHVEHTAPAGCVHRSTYVPDAHDTSEAGDQ
jgi:hypothetical protein